MKVGIIGGAGPYASALLYQQIIKVFYDQKVALPELVLLNFPFTRGLSLKESSQGAVKIIQELQLCFDSMLKQGVELVILACNTLHAFLKNLRLDGIRILHIPQNVVRKAMTLNLDRLLILGTQTTRQMGLYRHPSVELLYPQIEQQKIIDAIIDRILMGEISKKDSMTLSDLVMSQEDIDGVVLGCTDIPVLHHHHPLQVGSLPILDSIKIPAHYLYEELYETSSI